MDLCKVRYDGSHYLAQPYKNNSGNLTTEEIINLQSNDEELSFDKKKMFKNLWAEENFPFKSKGRKKISEYIKLLYDETKSYYYSLKEIYKTDEEIKSNMFDIVMSNNELVDKYDFDRNQEWLISYIEKVINREKENLKSRKNTFRRKAFNNDWNYFCTFTYDDKKQDEESFVRTLKKKLQNLHTNYGWLYMGCFERSKQDRLHFHGLLYVPDGFMRGNIRCVEYYDTTSHKKATSYINDEFEKRIGRNDFKPITRYDLTFTRSLDYILKYIGKSDEKIVYSRGLKDDVYCLMDFEENVICKVNKKSPYYVIADDEKRIELTKSLDKINYNY